MYDCDGCDMLAHTYNSTLLAASGGEDFIAFSEGITLTELAPTSCFAIAITDDSMPEGSESFNVKLSDASMVNRLTLSPNVTTVTIGG